MSKKTIKDYYMRLDHFLETFDYHYCNKTKTFEKLQVIYKNGNIDIYEGIFVEKIKDSDKYYIDEWRIYQDTSVELEDAWCKGNRPITIQVYVIDEELYDYYNKSIKLHD